MGSMTDRVRWISILGASCAVLAILMQVPFFIHVLHPSYEGVIPHFNSDEYRYLMRTQEALSGRPEQVPDAVVGTGDVEGMDYGLAERFYGMAFGWTGWRAATLMQVLDSILPPLIFLCTVWLLLLCGFDRRKVLIGSWLFILLTLYQLNRPVSPRASTLLLFLACILMIRGAEGRWIASVLGGMCLGLVVGVYFWGWTFAWCFWGVLFLWEGVTWWKDKKKTLFSRSRFFRVCLTGVVGGLVATPFFLQLWNTLKHPLYEVGQFRSGMYFSHLPESWVYTLCFVFMFIGIYAVFIRNTALRQKYKYGIVLLFTSIIVTHQQILHGHVLMFVSHYLFPLVLTAVVVLMISAQRKQRWLWISCAGATLYLLGIAYDNSSVLAQYIPSSDKFHEQHLVSAWETLDDMPRTTILSDPGTSHFIAASTQHDVVYSLFLKNTLLTHEEIAKRYCATQVFCPAMERNIEQEPCLIYPDANSAFPESDSRERELAIINKACGETDKDPIGTLQQLGATYVLWDEKRHPEWNLERFPQPLVPVASGEGWSLWQINAL